MSAGLDWATQQQIEQNIDQLWSEFDGRFPRPQIEEVMNNSVARLADTATVTRFLPVMAYRFTRERLQAISRAAGGGTSDTRDVVFVSLSGGGRGQIAAAITAQLSQKRVSVHSAGTASHATIDPQVRAVIEELGVDPTEAFARPVTDDVLNGADVIVTMGRSVGEIAIPPGVRHEDWRIGDPIGAPTDEVRRVRADIEYRVRALLSELGVADLTDSVGGRNN
jgi:protein-tyrosine-phosphatase